MAKAMLIMDMPSSCLDCPCSKYNQNIKRECCWECEANGMELSDIDLEIERPILCPLREVPQKKDINEAILVSERGYVEGYNSCIDEILGGGE